MRKNAGYSCVRPCLSGRCANIGIRSCNNDVLQKSCWQRDVPGEINASFRDHGFLGFGVAVSLGVVSVGYLLGIGWIAATAIAMN